MLDPRRTLASLALYARACDGAEALDYVYGEGQYAGRDASQLPAVVLLDLKLPKLSGLEVLQRLRGDPRTRLVPMWCSPPPARTKTC